MDACRRPVASKEAVRPRDDSVRKAASSVVGQLPGESELPGELASTVVGQLPGEWELRGADRRMAHSVALLVAARSRDDWKVDSLMVHSVGSLTENDSRKVEPLQRRDRYPAEPVSHLLRTKGRQPQLLGKGSTCLSSW